MMKKILIVICVTACCRLCFAQSESGNSQAKNVNSPNFLVHNQLTPEVLKVEYVAGVSKGDFENTSGEQVGQLSQNSFTVSGYPVTLMSKVNTQMYAGFGYSRTEYTSLSDASNFDVLRTPLESFNINAFVNAKVGNRLYWSTYLQAGVQGNEPFDDVERSHNEVVLTKLNFKTSRNFNAGLGAVYVSNLGDQVILPALAVVYSTERYLVNIDFPLKAEVEGILKNGKLRPVAGVTFPAASYYVKSVDKYLSTSGMSGYIGARYRVMDFVYAYVAYQMGLDETFEDGKRGETQEFGTYSNSGRLVASLSIQIVK